MSAPATSTAPPDDPGQVHGDRPPLIPWGDDYAPEAPATLEATGVGPEILSDLALKLAYTVPHFTTDWAAAELCLPLQLTTQLLEHLTADKLVEILGDAGPFSYRYGITGRGRERSRRLSEISGYVGPAPVSLEAYRALLEWQFGRLPEITPDQVREALAPLVLPDEAVQIAGLAISARRSLFMHGPPGNGKTAAGHLLHDAVEGYMWVPHCIGVDSSMVRMFDEQVHERVDLEAGGTGQLDRRWVRIRRPFIVVGGELTIEALDLAYTPGLGYYEAPLHMKANGGTFLLDDFGCQRVPPGELLNRWVFPLEHGEDYLTLQTGQQLMVPFKQMLVVSTNLEPDKVMSAAFLRRIGYRIHFTNPKPERYADIFRRYAADCDLAIAEGLVDGLLDRYETEDRPMRCCEPRDLIERARDICRFQGRPATIDEEVIDLAWRGYFGDMGVVPEEMAT